MKRFGIASMLTGGLVAAVIGMAAPAQADLSDVIWNQQQQHQVYVPHVDNSVRHSGNR